MNRPATDTTTYLTAALRITPRSLEAQNRRLQARGGRSQENHGLGFLPAFRDGETGRVYLSCFADGRPAPMHILDGLPPHLVLQRGGDGRVRSVTGSIICGFVLAGRFYTREEAASVVQRWDG
jgi:hypothetical protein